MESGLDLEVHSRWAAGLLAQERRPNGRADGRDCGQPNRQDRRSRGRTRLRRGEKDGGPKAPRGSGLPGNDFGDYDYPRGYAGPRRRQESHQTPDQYVLPSADHLGRWWLSWEIG